MRKTAPGEMQERSYLVKCVHLLDVFESVTALWYSGFEQDVRDYPKVG
jgi:hypothetical protein